VPVSLDGVHGRCRIRENPKMKMCTAALRSSRPTPAANLEGPSRTIIVEPIEVPAPKERPERPREKPKEPLPEREPAREPVPTP